MARLRSVLGYTWALALLPVVLATFIGMNNWAKTLAEVTGVKISPWYSGGETATVLQHAGYETIINKPVFQGLLSARKKGFVQIRWSPEKGSSLPASIDEEIDFDRDGANDFRVRIDTRTDRANLIPYGSNVVTVNQILRLENGRAVRIGLLNPDRR